MTTKPPELPGLDELLDNTIPLEENGGLHNTTLDTEHTPTGTTYSPELAGESETEPEHPSLEEQYKEAYTDSTEDVYDSLAGDDGNDWAELDNLNNEKPGLYQRTPNLDRLAHMEPLGEDTEEYDNHVSLDEVNFDELAGMSMVSGTTDTTASNTEGDSSDGSDGSDGDAEDETDDDEDLNKPNKKKRKKKKPRKTPSKALKKVRPVKLLRFATKPLQWALWVIDRVSIVFYWLQKIPVVGKLFKPLHTGAKLTRIIIGAIIPLLLLGIPLLLLFTGNNLAAVERTFPDNGKTIATQYAPNNSTLAVTIENTGAVIDDDLQPTITVHSKQLFNPTTWFTAKPVATCTTTHYTTLNPGETTTIELQCDSPITGVNLAYSGQLTP